MRQKRDCSLKYVVFRRSKETNFYFSIILHYTIFPFQSLLKFHEMSKHELPGNGFFFEKNTFSTIAF